MSKDGLHSDCLLRWEAVTMTSLVPFKINGTLDEFTFAFHHKAGIVCRLWAHKHFVWEEHSITRSLPADIPQEGPTCARSCAHEEQSQVQAFVSQDIFERYKTCTVRDVELHSTETDEDMEAIDPAIAGVFFSQ